MIRGVIFDMDGTFVLIQRGCIRLRGSKSEKKSGYSITTELLNQCLGKDGSDYHGE